MGRRLFKIFGTAWTPRVVMSTQLRDGLAGRKSFPWDLHVCLLILFVVVKSYSLLRSKEQDDAQKK